MNAEGMSDLQLGYVLGYNSGREEGLREGWNAAWEKAYRQITQKLEDEWGPYAPRTGYLPNVHKDQEGVS